MTDSRRIRVYIAGPYSKGDTVVNVRNALVAANQLLDCGYAPYCPHLTMFLHMLSPRDVDFWYQFDLEWLVSCDILLRLPGPSTGADREVELANREGIPVVNSIEEIAVAIRKVRDEWW